MFSPVIKVHGPNEDTKECDNGKYSHFVMRDLSQIYLQNTTEKVTPDTMATAPTSVPKALSTDGNAGDAGDANILTKL